MFFERIELQKQCCTDFSLQKTRYNTFGGMSAVELIDLRGKHEENGDNGFNKGLGVFVDDFFTNYNKYIIGM